MPLIPYQPGMQLGRGYSSVNQTLKKFDAVAVTGVTDPADIDPTKLKMTQNVSYMLRLVNSVSEACDVLGITGSVAIQTATIKVSLL